MTKAEIRQNIKNILGKINQSKLKEYSEQICNKIINSQEYKKSTIILGYMALFDEVDLSLLMKDAFEQNKTIYLPHVFPSTNKMEFYKFKSDSKVITGEFGITEPEQTEPFILSSLDKNTKLLALIPGRAFTKTGERLGRGKGFYDIYFEKLAANKNIHMKGVCFPEQIVDFIPTTPNDIKMTSVVY